MDVIVCLIGEIGMGKEVVVWVIYNNSFRKNGLFIVVNCGVVFEKLIESELFGYMEGVFIGVKWKGQIGVL